MKKNKYLSLAACLCVAGLSTCISNVANADAPAMTQDASVSILQSEATGNAGQPSQMAGSQPANLFDSGSAATGSSAQRAAFSAAAAQSQPFDPVLHYSVVPEPTTTALLIGLGVLVGFKRLRIGHSNN